MKDCEKAAHILAYAVVYFHGLRMVRESYYGITTLNGFPGTENELQRFLEAMRCVESTLYKFQQAAWEFAEDCGGRGVCYSCEHFDGEREERE